MGKIKLFIILEIFIFISYSVTSQNLFPEWIRPFSQEEIYSSCIEVDNVGNYLIRGEKSNPVYIDSFLVENSYIAKFTSFDSLLWINEMIKYIPDLKTDTNNNIYIRYYPQIIYGFAEMVLAKLKPSGQLEWEIVFKYINSMIGGGVGSTFKLLGVDKENNIVVGVNLFDRIVLPNGDTLISYFGNTTSNLTEYIILKFNTDGALVNFYHPMEYGILTDYNTDNEGYSYHLIEEKKFRRFDLNDSLIAEKIMTSDYYNFCVDNSKYIYSTTIGSDTLFDNQTTEDTITENNLFVVKLDTSFGVVWHRKIKGFSFQNLPYLNYYTLFNSFKTIINDSLLYVIGAMKYKMSINGDTSFSYTTQNTPYNPYSMSFFIIKFDINGNYYWTEMFHTNDQYYSASNPTYLCDLKVLSDYTLLYEINFYSQFEIGNQIFINNSGKNEKIILRLQETGAGLKPLQENKFFSFEVYPNPASGFTNISVDSDNDIDFLLQLYDISGRCVISETHSSSKKNISLNISHLRSGLYFIKLQTAKKIAVKKILVF